MVQCYRDTMREVIGIPGCTGLSGCLEGTARVIRMPGGRLSGCLEGGYQDAWREVIRMPGGRLSGCLEGGYKDTWREGLGFVKH